MMTSTRLVVVGSGQAEPTVGVSTQVLPIPTGEYGKYGGELGGLLDEGARVLY